VQIDLSRPESEWGPILRKQVAFGGAVVALTKSSLLPSALKELLEGNSLEQRRHSSARCGTKDLASHEDRLRIAERSGVTSDDLSAVA